MPDSMRDLCQRKEEVWARIGRPNFANFHIIAGFFNMPQSCDVGQTALLPLRRKACWGFCRPKSPTALAGSEPTNLGTRGQHANHYTTEAIVTPSVHIILLQLLMKSDVLNCQHSMIDLMTNSYAQKAALWCLYGKTDMWSLSSQLLLHLNTSNPTQGIQSYNGEGTCQAICNVANTLMEQVCCVCGLCMYVVCVVYVCMLCVRSMYVCITTSVYLICFDLFQCYDDWSSWTIRTITNSMHCLSSVYRVMALLCVSWLPAGQARPAGSQLRSITSAICHIYTFYLLMMGSRYTWNM
jgi:hypothetical protein